MIQIVIGLVLFVLGAWGVVRNWYSFVDLIWVLGPMLLIVVGVVAIVSGINTYSSRGKVPRGARGAP
jgi:uncharacterized membrane protein HdeD (DUF308 family)